MTKEDLILQELITIKKENTLQHQNIISHQKETNGNVKINSEFRLKNEALIISLRETAEDVIKFKSGLSIIKWLVSFIGVGQVVYFLTLIF